MGRPSKPFFKTQNQTWYCSIAGRQINLDKDKETAEIRFHELMADRDSVLS